jgi:nucleoid DNA-binding protein
MNKEEFVHKTHKEMGLTKTEINKSLDIVLTALSNVFEAREEVKFMNFGTFGIKYTKAKTGTHPKTKEPLIIKANNKPYFKASSQFTVKED